VIESTGNEVSVRLTDGLIILVPRCFMHPHIGEFYVSSRDDESYRHH